MKRGAAIGTAVVCVFVAVAVGVAFAFGAVSVAAVVGYVVTAAIAVVLVPITRSLDMVTLTQEVLPHRKGYTAPGGWVKGVQGQPETFEVTEPRDTHPEVKQAERSQLWQVFWWASGALNSVDGMVPPVATNLFVVKFGVLRFTASGGSVENCRVKAYYRPVPTNPDTPKDGGWQDLGQLNWYSDEVRNRILSAEGPRDSIAKSPSRGMNPHLKNPERTIHDGEDADLPLFYMIMGQPTVFVAGAHPYAKAGDSILDAPVTFDLKLSVVGKGLAKTRPKVYRVSAAWDDFRIDPTPGWLARAWSCVRSKLKRAKNHA